MKEKTKTSLNNKTKKKKSFFEKMPRLPLMIILFLLLWAFNYFVYADVYYMCQQHSYFAFDKTLMQNIIAMWDAPFILVGRFLLLSCHYKIFGTLLLTVFMWFIAYLVDYCFNLKGYWKWIAYLVPFTLIAFYVSWGMNIYYAREASKIFYIPVTGVIVFLIAAIIIRIITKRKFTNPLLLANDSAKSQWLQLAIMLIMFIGITFYQNRFSHEAKNVSTLQCLMEKEEWHEMADYVKENIEYPTRAEAAYYALALEMTDRIDTELFNINYTYPESNTKGRGDYKDASTDLYVTDCNFFTGLVNSSYHWCIENSVLDGITVNKLKRLVMCCLINNEMQLAKKFLYILDEVPCERDFVQKYVPMLNDYKMVCEDPMLSKVMEILPLDNVFEQRFTQPMFVGYYNKLKNGRCYRALYNSMAACFYTKDVEAFVKRMPTFMNSQMPQNYQEAITIAYLDNLKQLKEYRFINPYYLTILKNFIHEVFDKKENFNVKEKAKECEEAYKGTYEYYFYLQNMPEDAYNKQNIEKAKEKEKENHNKGGVN